MLTKDRSRKLGFKLDRVAYIGSRNKNTVSKENHTIFAVVKWQSREKKTKREGQVVSIAVLFYIRMRGVGASSTKNKI